MPEWITVTAAARQLGIAERTVRDRIAKGSIIARKEGNKWLIDAGSIGGTGGGDAAEETPSAATAAVGGGDTIQVPIERYEQLVISVTQMGMELSENRKMLEAHTSEKEHYRADLEAREREIAELRGELEYYQQPFYKRWFGRRRERK